MRLIFLIYNPIDRIAVCIECDFSNLFLNNCAITQYQRHSVDRIGCQAQRLCM